MRAPDFWTRRTDGAKALAALLSPAAALYGVGVRLSKSRHVPFRAGARVLCVGNLTVGGTGKTPIAIALGRMLAARGVSTVFLTRGYGGGLAGPVLVDPTQHGAHAVGDEALLLAAAAPTIVSRDRAAGARLADSMGARCIVMDDGFQNFSVAKDLSLIVVDAETGFGNGHLLPAGPLREPVRAGLARADAIIVMGDGAPPLPPFDGPVIEARLCATAAGVLHDRHVFAFAGIGRPEKFFRTLRERGATIVETREFPDHHRYTPDELNALRKSAKQADLLLVTTEKDYVRIDARQRDGIVPFPVRAAFADDAALERLLDRLAPGPDHPTP